MEAFEGTEKFQLSSANLVTFAGTCYQAVSLFKIIDSGIFGREEQSQDIRCEDWEGDESFNSLKSLTRSSVPITWA